MEPDEYKRLFELEHRLWWFLGMRQISRALLDKYHPQGSREGLILDAGCGTGGMLGTLALYGKPFGADASLQALDLARTRGRAPLVQADVCRLPFTSESFDLVTCFDVLYHLRVSSDVEALLEIARVLRPDGLLMLRVPAIKLFRGRHDLAVHTRQRYGRRELVRKLATAGFVPAFVSYVNFLLLPLALLRRGIDHWLRPGHQGSEVEPLPLWLDRTMLQFLRLESRWIRFLPLPVGLSLVTIARKSGVESNR